LSSVPSYSPPALLRRGDGKRTPPGHPI
jgi:hypothetical protein